VKSIGFGSTDDDAHELTPERVELCAYQRALVLLQSCGGWS